MMTENYLIRVKDGVAIQYTTKGTHIRNVVSKDAQSGIVVNNEIIITMKDGKTRIYTINGTHVRTIG